jgi:hypothetical protein
MQKFYGILQFNIKLELVYLSYDAVQNLKMNFFSDFFCACEPGIGMAEMKVIIISFLH